MLFVVCSFEAGFGVEEIQWRLNRAMHGCSFLIFGLLERSGAAVWASPIRRRNIDRLDSIASCVVLFHSNVDL